MNAVTLSTILSLREGEASREIQDLRRAESLAPKILAARGVLITENTESDDDFHRWVFKEQLSESDRDDHDARVEALTTVRVTVEGKSQAACDVACDAYTPAIDAAYHLGLAVGYAAGLKVGGK
jgi:hypothetical protein